MTQTNIPNLSVEEIMQKIKLEVKKRKSSPNIEQTNSIINESSTIHIPTFNMTNNKIDVVSKRDLPFVVKDIYEYPDFTKYHDIEFVQNLYKGILKREPDIAGLQHYLEFLRSGKRTKSEIISSLRYSSEGKAKGVTLLGSKKRYLSYAMTRLPLLGKVYKWALYIATLPKIIQRINEYEAHTNQRFSEIREDTISLQEAINSKTDIANINNIQTSISSLNAFVNTKADKTAVESLQEDIETKADKTAVESLQEDIETKADKTAVESLQEDIETKADKTAVESLQEDIETKADKTAVESLQEDIETKADKTAVESLQEDIETKADKTAVESLQEDIETKADKTAVESLQEDIETKADKTAVESLQEDIETKADKTAVESLQEDIETKADKTAVESLQEDIETKADKTAVESLQEDIETKADKTAVESLQEDIETKADKTAVESLQEDIETKADKTAVESLQEDIETKADKTAVESLQEDIETKADKTAVESLQEDIETKVSHKDLELYLQTVSYAKEYMKISQQNMQNLIDEAKKRLPDEVLNQKELLAITDEEKHKFDTFYVEFEDKFRGSREDIKQRVEVYLPYVENLPFKKEDIKALDVGCGRGEWLELLGEQGYKNTKGLDLNRIMVSKSQELGLDVIESDVIEYLKNQEDESLSIITGFHIIEHLPFEILMKLFEESYRVLQRGGMVIFETPNPENLVVGACNFYSDPTHINPIPPHTSNFVLEARGFSQVEIKRLHQPENIYYEDKFINHQFAVGQDYAVIGYKI